MDADPGRPGRRDRPFYSGKHKKHGMNLLVIASPDGDILWVSGLLPGSVHDKKAEWIWGIPAELEAAGLFVLADKGYQGARTQKSRTGEEQARIPERRQPRPRETPDTRRAPGRPAQDPMPLSLS